MRVDLVTGPVRYRSAPLLALVALALIPVALLVALLVWSDAEADEYEAAGNGAPTEPASVPPASAATPQLATPMIAYRRAPARVASVGDDNQLAAAMDQLYVFVDGRSCVGVAVDGRTVTTRNPTTPVIPASVHKLLVAAVALEVLGPDHRFTTTVAAPAAVDGVVQGDVYLVGGGDPLLTSADFPITLDRYPAFNTTSIDALADAVVAAGVTTVRGSIIGDGTRYDDEFTIGSWGPGVALVEAGPIDALMVNDARVLGRTGRENDPNVAAAREFTRLLNNRGVDVTNGWGTGAAPADVPVVASVDSAPLIDVLTEMLTTSDDDTAEMLLKELGVADSGEGTVPAGLNVVDRVLRTWGVPMDGVRLADASGLSPDNNLTCATVLGVLDRLSTTPLVDALPLAGRTGTLAAEFVGSPVEGRLAAKTGTLGNPPEDLDPPAVKGLAGFLTAENGARISFVMILNAPGVSTEEGYRPFWGALIERLAAYPGGPDPATLGPR